jgi:integrase
MLTDGKIKGAIAKAEKEGRPIAVYDAGKVAGLELRAYPGGRASFCYLYRPPGAANRQRYPLGHYSSTFGLAEARRKVSELRDKRAAGIDPLAHRNQITHAQLEVEAARKAKEAEDAARITVARLCELFLAAKAELPWIKRYREIVNHDIVPTLGTCPAAAIARADVQQLVDGVRARGAHAQAKRAFEAMRAILKWGVGRDHLMGEPWRGVDLPAGGQPRTRLLSAAELRWTWNLAGQWIAGVKAANQGRILRLLILTGQRSGEVNGMQRSEISRDLMTWTIPATRSKNGRAHAVPMPPLSRTILQEVLLAIPRKQQHLFVGSRGKPARPDDLAHDLADAIADYNKGRSEEDRVSAFVVHDIRRTVASGLEAMGIPLTVISAALNHVSAKAASVTTKHYTHADLSDEIRVALTRWQATLDHVLAGDDPFTAKPEDIDELEKRALAQGFGGPAQS